jgi:dihydropteroate synthase
VSRPMLPHLRITANWRLRSQVLPLVHRTLVMGIVNITPDSFSDGGLYLSTENAVKHALHLLDEGADILDLGAESTRPGVHVGEDATVAQQEEHLRLMPVLESILKARPDAVISVDTYKAATARAAVSSGAEIVNDVSGFTWDRAMAATCAELRCGVVLMHTRGTPDQWRTQPPLPREMVVPSVRDGLAASMQAALAAGISRDAIVLDPGYGFGKRLDENYELLARQAELLELGQPLLAGLSRKSFLARTLWRNPGSTQLDHSDISTASRETASIAALVTAILHGAAIVRVHEVRAAVEAAAIADAVLAAR